MPKQKIEIEVDVPSGWELTGEFRPINTNDYYLDEPGSASQWIDDATVESYFILRRREPVRKSRWGWACCSFSSYEAARAAYPNIPLVRADHVDGKLVAVTLEPQ